MRVLQQNNVVATFPTSIGQKRCWFMEQIHPGNRGLNLAVRWELRGPATSDMVQEAFNRIIARHEVLRTCFVERDGEPLQEVYDSVNFKVDIVDVQRLKGAERAERINQIAVEHSEQPFDMGVPCLLRVTMVRTDAQRAELLIAVHNAIFDGFSIGVLGHELGQTLEAISKGTEPDLPPLELQYGDYAQWLEEYEKSGAMDVEQAFWVEALRGMPYFELPSDRPRTPGHPQTSACASDLPADFEKKLGAAAKTLGTSVFALGTSAFSIALARFSGQSDVSFAVQVAGRTDIDLEPLIGIFTNPIVLRFKVEEDDSLAHQAEATRTFMNGALAHQMLPFDKLVQAINPVRDPLRIPLVSIMFNLQKAFLQERTYGDLELASVLSHSPATLYDLNINIVGRKSGWGMVIDYDSRLFDHATIRAFSDLLVDVFARMTDAPETLIAELPAAARNNGQDVSDLPDVVAEQTPTAAFEDTGKLKAIWADFLGLPEAQIAGSFFDLGGHSVLALRMLARVGDEFGNRPSMYAFLGDPTLDGLAKIVGQPETVPEVTAPEAVQKQIDTATKTSVWDLIELRAGADDGPVLLTVNQPFMYHALAAEMNKGCTVANVGVPGFAELEALRQRGFNDTVADAARMVKERYGNRPLVLCGLCVDGRVALGLAQALRQIDTQVAVVGMIDTWAPGAVKEFSNLSRAGDRWRIRLRRLRYYLGLRAKGEIKWRDVFSQNDVGAAVLRRMGLVSDKNDVEDLVDATVDCLVAQTRAYDFDPYDGEVVLFVTRSQGQLPRDGVLGWSHKLARDVAVYPVNGWHGDALTRSGFGRVVGVLDEKLQRLAADHSP